MKFLVIVSLTLIAASGGFGDLVPGKVYPLKIVDVDGRTLSTSDGHVTVLVLADRGETDKARLVGDRIPERCLGNPIYRMITVIRFDNSWRRSMRFLSTAMIRRRLDAEAKRLKPRYAAKNVTRNPRDDVHAVADYNGEIASQLGLESASPRFRLLVFGQDGALLGNWTNVPAAQELASTIP
jgi:hypothetical protein